MRVKRKIERPYFLTLIILAIFVSCIDETFNSCEADSYVTFSGINMRALNNPEEFPGEPADDYVYTLRILAFDKATGICASNVVYNKTNGDVIVHPINGGEYNFVFLANEPPYVDINNTLNGIQEGVTNYSILNTIAYPADAFTSEARIPMMEERTIKVLSNGKAEENGTELTSPVVLKLIRLGTRIDAVLSAPENLEQIFTGVTFSNLPDKVPLTSGYTGTIEHSLDNYRSFTLDNNDSYFEDTSKEGATWAKKVKRVILPANVINPVDNENNSITFTVNLEGKYNPDCKLEIDDKDYRLPKNSKLDLDAKIKMPIEVNIKASEWITDPNDWQTAPIRMLNVSHSAVNITDFNGARISFSTNMHNVRVLPEVTYVNGNIIDVTNRVFNDLAATTDNPQPTRFYFDSSTKAGYMDILVDSINTIGERTYKLFLVGEDENGKNQLKKEITVTINQYGTRANFNRWETTGYVGAFFRKNETGERIITGQHLLGQKWTATVIEGQDWITLSSAPSFDPKAGTNEPGKAENYKVIPNTKKYVIDQKNKVTGKGRIYFRIGVDTKPTVNRYGVIQMTLHMLDSNGNIYENKDHFLYIRQGEDDDYIFSDDEPIVGGTRTNTRKFAAYNLTASNMKGVSINGITSVQVPKKTNDIGGGVFVDYPTQAGAHFQWGTNPNDTENNHVLRLAYHPAKSTISGWKKNITDLFWNNLKDENEICPKGYVRPNDGFEDQKAYNGSYASGWTTITLPPDNTPGDYSNQIYESTIRMSLLKEPLPGNVYKESPIYENGVLIKDTIPPTCSPLSAEEDYTSGGFYADGFFDRRPIDLQKRAVSTDNSDIAYGGVIFFNKEKANRSVFFPSAGRRNDNTGNLEFQGSGAYIWTSSAGPWYPKDQHPGWNFTLSYYYIAPSTNIKGFGCSIRCVADPNANP